QLKTPVDRRFFASAILRLPVNARTGTLKALTQFSEDATDHVLTQLYWYALEPLAAEKPAEALAIAANAKVPLLPLAARRVGALATQEAVAVLVNDLAKATDPKQQLAFLGGLQEANKGKRTTEAPKGWADVYAKLNKSDNADVQNTALSLAVVYGD